MLLFFYTTIRTRFVIFTCRYFKFNRNTTNLSQSNYRNFSCSGITNRIYQSINWNIVLLYVPKAVNGYCVAWLASTFFSFPTFAASENTLLIFSPPSRPALQKMTEKIFGVHCHAMKNKIANHSIQKD